MSDPILSREENAADDLALVLLAAWAFNAGFPSSRTREQEVIDRLARAIHRIGALVPGWNRLPNEEKKP